MNNQRLQIGKKYGAYMAAVYVVAIILNIVTYDPESSTPVIFILTSILTWVGLIVFICMAHYEFNHKNLDYISFKDAIYIGLIIIGVAYVLSLVSAYLTYEFITKAKLESGEIGYPMSEGFSMMAALVSTLAGLFIQVFVLFFIIAMEAQWKIYKKAGKEGWATLVPIYNIVVLLEIVGKPVWWIVMLVIPGVNMIFAIWIINLLAKKFGKEESYTIGLILLPFVFYPMLGLSKLEYRKSEAMPLAF